MSGRYSRLFTLPENLYAAGAPIVISAGALLKDNQTGKVLAQLKFRNISPKEIKAIKVNITPLDTVSHPLGAGVEYQYLDLTAHRGNEFGQKSPISLPDAATRAFLVKVQEVVYADNIVWQAKDEPWEPLKKSVFVSDKELLKQIQMEYGNSFLSMPTTDKDLWICSCGEMNHKEETECFHCGQKLLHLLEMDMEDLKTKRDARVAAETAQAEKECAAAEAQAKKIKKLASIIIPILAVIIVATMLISGNLKKKAAYNEAMALAEAEKYAKAVAILEEAGYDNAEELAYGSAYHAARALFEANDFEAAGVAFEKLGNYSDSAEWAKKSADRAEEVRCQTAYEQAEELLAQGETARAAMAFYAIEGYQDARERSFTLWDELLRVRNTADRGIFLKRDGSVSTDGSAATISDENLADWSKIVEVSSGNNYIAGLNADGTVVTVGFITKNNSYKWQNITQISAGADCLLGLRENGSVVSTGEARLNGYSYKPFDVSGWRNIVAVSVSDTHAVGLKADGTVLATTYGPYSTHQSCNVSHLRDIVAVATGHDFTVCLKADGTVVVEGYNSDGQCDVSDWENIVAIAAGDRHTVGLKADGTVVVVGSLGSSNVSQWKDIVAIYAWGKTTIGLKADGTVVGNNWTELKLPTIR